MNTYTPQPGSVPARVLEYLRSFADGDEFPTGTLCKALDVSSASLITSLETAKRNDLVRAHKAGKTTMWSLGDGSRVAAPPAPPDFKAQWTPPKMTPPRGETPIAAAAPEPESAAIDGGGVIEEAADEAVEFEFCQWRDGSLTVWGVQANEDGSVTLLPDQVREIKARIAWSPA